MKLVFATNNANKLEEVQHVVGDQFKLVSLADIGCEADIPETGDTFEANAGQKSQYLLDRYQVNCFADDSGLEVYALNGAPGVYSARYSGSRDMTQNLSLLLKNLENQTDRRACFRTVISLRLDGQHYLFEGKVEGHIIEQEIGDKGFGYDPVFVPTGYDKTFAQMEMNEKNAISHRSIAVAKMAEFLTNPSRK